MGNPRGNSNMGTSGGFLNNYKSMDSASNSGGNIFGQNSASKPKMGGGKQSFFRTVILGIFGAASSMGISQNSERLKQMLADEAQPNEESKIDTSGNKIPPEVKITETSKLMLEMGFKSLIEKVYSEENAELDGENVISYYPPTQAQAAR